jgi:hypothetical protein
MGCLLWHRQHHRSSSSRLRLMLVLCMIIHRSAFLCIIYVWRHKERQALRTM